MSSLYERWKPKVGDRVRIVERNETGAAVKTGRVGTVVMVHEGEPEALCDVQYDDALAASPEAELQQHAAAELEPLDASALGRGDQPEPQPRPVPGGDEAWQPTVGDRVLTPEGREATVTAIDERPDGTRCEVEYNHQPGEQGEPLRGVHPLSELTPTREPSAEALERDART